MLEVLLFDPDICSDKIMGLSFIGLKIFGFVFTKDQYFKNLHMLRGFFFATTFTIINFMQALSLLYAEESLTLIAPGISTTLLFFTNVFRMSSFCLNYKEVGHAIRHIHQDLKTLILETSSKEHRIYKKHAKHLLSVNLSLWVPCVLSASLTILSGVYHLATLYEEQHSNSTETPFVVKIIPFTNFTDNTFVAYIIPLYAIVIAASFLCFWNSFIAAMMVYVILFLDIINNRLENIEDFVVRCSGDLNRQRLNILTVLVRKQIMLKKFVTQIENLIKGTVFLDFCIFSVLLCFLLYVLSQAPLNLDFFIMLIYINAMVSALWLFHWHANEITILSKQTSDSLYSSNWFTYSTRVQRFCLIAMIGSTRPIKLRAYFIDIGLVTFMNILRASYSFFTLLSNFDN